MVEDIINHHQLVVLDGVTRARDNDADLRYNLETPDDQDMLILLKIHLVYLTSTPFIIPVGNPNGIRITNLVYDSSTDTVAATLKVAYSFAE